MHDVHRNVVYRLLVRSVARQDEEVLSYLLWVMLVSRIEIAYVESQLMNNVSRIQLNSAIDSFDDLMSMVF